LHQPHCLAPSLHLFDDFYGAHFSAFRCDLVQREGFVVFNQFQKTI
jgi:hypothetical protein